MPFTIEEVAAIVQWLSANGWKDKVIAERMGISTSWAGRLRRRVI